MQCMFTCSHVSRAFNYAGKALCNAWSRALLFDWTISEVILIGQTYDVLQDLNLFLDE